jgi:hypothetical protein
VFTTTWAYIPTAVDEPIITADEFVPLTLIVVTVALNVPSAEQPVMSPLLSSFKTQASE